MIRHSWTKRFGIAQILAAHWPEFVATHQGWIRPVVFENVRRVLACRTPALGCHLYRCKPCGEFKAIPHSCKSRLCPVCGKVATDRWADELLNGLLDVPYHHLVLAMPCQLRSLIGFNRQHGLNLLVQAAIESVQQWARDVKGMRMGVIAVIHTFGADLKWHPHIHLIVTGGGLSLDGKKWIRTDPRWLMNHAGLKKRWKYQVISRMKKAHREGVWRFPEKCAFLKEYRYFGGMLNKLWPLTWFAYIGASLLDPRFSIRYIGRYTKRAVLAEYRITHYDGSTVRFWFKDYAKGGKRSYKTMKVCNFIGRLVQHVPEKGFQMIRHAGLFCNRWKAKYLQQARQALGQPEPATQAAQREAGGANATELEGCPRWEQRQRQWQGEDPLKCPCCGERMEYVGEVFGRWVIMQEIFEVAGRVSDIPPPLLAGVRKGAGRAGRK